MGQLAIYVDKNVKASFESIEQKTKQFNDTFAELMMRVHKIALEQIPLIAEWAQNMLIYFGIAVLFLSNSTIFVIGMCFGVLNTKVMDGMLEDIQTVAKRILKNKNFIQLALMVTSAVLAWPISLATTAFFVGGYYGSQLKKPYGEADHI